MKMIAQISGRRRKIEATSKRSLLRFQPVEAGNSIDNAHFLSGLAGRSVFLPGVAGNRRVNNGLFLRNDESVDACFMRRVMLIVTHNFADFEFSAEVLSQKLAVSRRHFFRKFKLLFNCTPNVFIRHVRLKQAAWLLNRSQTTVTEIIFSVGFSDPKHFRVIFRRQFGMLPSEYLKRGHQSNIQNTFFGIKTQN